MQPIRALGAMSGTSLDGIDAAELVTDGETVTRFGASDFLAYSPEDRATLRSALGRWPGEAGVARAAEVVETRHAHLLGRFEGAQVVGFHGQTLMHAPETRRTHQAGDGAALAQALDLPVVWDFRSADVTLGGEGAPLAPVFHHACARHVGATEPLAFLNLGGVGNLTWVDPAEPDPGAALLAFDTGPANAPIDDLCARVLDLPYDADGTLARSGRTRDDLVTAFLSHPYFARTPPKSLDRDAFRDAGAAIDALPPGDAAASWVAAIAASVAHGLAQCPTPPARVLVTGGGRRNPAIMEALAAALPCPVAPVEAVGLDGDMLEAQAFAFLAVRVLRGLPTSFPSTTGVPVAVGGGTLTVPDGAVAPPCMNARQHKGRRIDGPRQR